MAMKAAKRGVRASEGRITINDKIKTITFSVGFFRTQKLNHNNTQYVRFGYDVDTNEIGIDFLRKFDSDGEAMKLTYTKSKSAASCPIRSLLATFNMDIKDISGTYINDAIIGPTKIIEFTDQGFLLKINKRTATR